MQWSETHTGTLESAMSDVTPKVLPHFEIKCRTCGGCHVEVYFYAGQASDQGYLGFRCNACGKSLDVVGED